jgi:NADPH2:quinone reductase
MYPAKPPLPHILGRDGVGDVLAVGPGVNHLRVGETVGILRCNAGVETWGTLAEKAVIPAASIAPIPHGWSLDEMAGAPLVFLTAWQALTQWEPRSAASPGSVLLVTGASGASVASAAGQVDGAYGGGTIEARRRAPGSNLGADFVFDPRDENLRKVATRRLRQSVDLGG